jgi:hypothetical protein
MTELREESRTETLEGEGRQTDGRTDSRRGVNRKTHHISRSGKQI